MFDAFSGAVSHMPHEIFDGSTTAALFAKPFAAMKLRLQKYVAKLLLRVDKNSVFHPLVSAEEGLAGMVLLETLQEEFKYKRQLLWLNYRLF